ncbi:MAG: PQQ-binding-like beta-propeller repeat protein [Gemmataceae bacterium]
MGRHRAATRRLAAVLAAVAAGGLVYVLAVRNHGPGEGGGPVAPEVVWAFEAHKRGAILSTPLVAGDHVYAAAVHDPAFTNTGAVYCLDRATGKLVWSFDDGGHMQHTFSSPCLADGRLYIGEGMHANFVCKLYCLDAATGRKLWNFEAAGHIESSPCVADGKVYFGAGDDGVYCLDAVTGRKRWRFAGPFHVDSAPAVSGGKVFVGSGVSRLKRVTEVICLGADDGKVVWRLPTDLPVWGSPLLSGDDVFFGLGNGRLLTGPEPPETPAGAMICLDAGTGRLRWRYDVGRPSSAGPPPAPRASTSARGTATVTAWTAARDRPSGRSPWAARS